MRSYNPPVEPPELVPSVYGPATVDKPRGKDYPGMVSVPVLDLFPDLDRPIYRSQDGDLADFRRAAQEALARVDMSMIQPRQTVNVLCSEHGFGMDGGRPYAEMLGQIRDVIVERTGCRNVRLIVVAWLGRKEPGELIEFFDLHTRFEGKVRGVTPSDAAIEIETVLGTLYGLRQIYNADWIVHTHYDDPREVYAHRAIDRITKPFGMSYARMETRSSFHMMMGPRTGNLIGRAVADSDFVQSKLAFTTVLLSSPAGIRGVDADNDLHAVGDRVTANMLRNYGSMLALFREIEDAVPIIDGSKWPYYNQAGGAIFGQMFFNGRDWWDLDLPDETANTEKLVGANVSLTIASIVMNHTLTGLSVLGLPSMYPVVVAGSELAETLRRDFANAEFMDLAEEAPDLFAAIETAIERGESDRLICFDGTYGDLNVSRSMADHLYEVAPAAAAQAAADLPRWLAQRGIDPAGRTLALA